MCWRKHTHFDILSKTTHPQHPKGFEKTRPVFKIQTPHSDGHVLLCSTLEEVKEILREECVNAQCSDVEHITRNLLVLQNNGMRLFVWWRLPNGAWASLDRVAVVQTMTSRTQHDNIEAQLVNAENTPRFSMFRTSDPICEAEVSEHKTKSLVESGKHLAQEWELAFDTDHLFVWQMLRCGKNWEALHLVAQSDNPLFAAPLSMMDFQKGFQTGHQKASLHAQIKRRLVHENDAFPQ